MLKLENEWIWDSWYLKDGDKWHCWFLKSPKSIGSPMLRHFNVSHGHATSKDLIDWEYHGTVYTPADMPSWDDYCIWTGSTLRGGDGKWHYFYTGTSHSEKGKVQRIGHAISKDLKNWKRVEDGMCLDLTGPNAQFYETDWEGRWHDRAMRDPWVIRDPDGTGWLMFFTSRVSEQRETNDAGCIGFAISPDLYSWELQPPVYIGGWGELEVPQIFECEKKWYCLFSMSSKYQAEWNLDKNGKSGRGSHYLMADNPRGPWYLPAGPMLDTKINRYASRIVNCDGLKILGFKDGEEINKFGGFIMDPEPVRINENKTLTLEII